MASLIQLMFTICRAGQNRIYIYAVHDRIFRNGGGAAGISSL